MNLEREATKHSLEENIHVDGFGSKSATTSRSTHEHESTMKYRVFNVDDVGGIVRKSRKNEVA